MATCTKLRLLIFTLSWIQTDGSGVGHGHGHHHVHSKSKTKQKFEMNNKLDITPELPKETAFNVKFRVAAEQIPADEFQQYILETLTNNGIISDAIKKPPPFLVNLDYGSHNCVHMGNELSPTQTHNQPTMLEYPSEASGLYTLVFIDLDSPSRSNSSLGQVVHWLVVNIPESRVNQGDVIAEYISPMPDTNTGKHRMVYLIYKQHDRIDRDSLPYSDRCGMTHRYRFNSSNYQKKFNLKGPLAVNFFLTEADSMVNTIHQMCHMVHEMHGDDMMIHGS